MVDIYGCICDSGGLNLVTSPKTERYKKCFLDLNWFINASLGHFCHHVFKLLFVYWCMHKTVAQKIACLRGLQYCLPVCTLRETERGTAVCVYARVFSQQVNPRGVSPYERNTTEMNRNRLLQYKKRVVLPPKPAASTRTHVAITCNIKSEWLGGELKIGPSDPENYAQPTESSGSVSHKQTRAFGYVSRVKRFFGLFVTHSFQFAKFSLRASK